MKKYILFILSILLTFSFISCDTNKQEPYTDITFDSVNDEYSVNHKTYTSLISDSVNDEYSMNSEVDYWTGMYFKKENMTDRTCFAYGKNYSGSYSKSIIDKMNSYTTDIYVDNNNIEFGLRSDTGELAYINLMNADFFDTQPYLPEIDAPNETAISLSTEIASHYVDNIEDYTQIYDEPITRYKERNGKTYQITYYIVTFAKKINGYFSSDYIAVKVTSKGTLASIMMGDIGAFDNTTLNFDTTIINQSISNKIESAYKKSELRVRKSSVDDQKIVLTPNGDICMYSNIIIYGVNNSNIETKTGVVILTILEKQNK